MLATKPQNKSVSAELDKSAAQIRRCILCPLHASRTLAVPGEGKPNARFMSIGEAPGKDEDKTGHPFVGSGGRYLDHVLAGTGLDRTDFFITNIVKCRPPGNRPPKSSEIETCTTHYLSAQIDLVNPKLILLLGLIAVKKMLCTKSVDEARGRVLEVGGRKFIATYHPAARFYREDLAAKIKADFALFKRELQNLTPAPPLAKAA
jgi:DNA polymerase